MNEINPTEFGELKATVKHLAKTLEDQTRAMREMSDRIKTVEDTLLEAKGGWKVMMWIAGGSSAAGALATWFLKDIMGR